MRNTKISIIIPVYNGEKTLRQCLESVLNQTYENYEVIVVDNDSTDKTKEVIKEFCKKNEKVKYVFEAKRGRGAARNAGIKRAKGEIIAMTDSDCIVPENWVEKLTQPIIYENETAVMGFQKDLIKNFWTENIQKADWECIKRNLNGKYITHVDTKNFAIKTFTLKKLMFGPKIPRLIDLDLYLRLKKIAKIRFIPSLRVGHYHKSSLIKTIKLNFNRAFWATKIYKKYGCVKDEILTESISIKNFISFPLWMVLQFTKRPIGEAYFILVSELSWRLGIIWARVKK